MNTQLKILLYIIFVAGIFYFVQSKYDIFDISFEKEDNMNEEVKEERNYIEILNIEERTILVEVEVANTLPLREQGLSGRSEIGDYQGMLFVFEQDGIYPFWMKDMLIPLDMIFVNSNGKIVDIVKDTQPCEGDVCERILAKEVYMYVIEVNAGFTETNRVEIGNTVHINILEQN